MTILQESRNILRYSHCSNKTQLAKLRKLLADADRQEEINELQRAIHKAQDVSDWGNLPPGAEEIGRDVDRAGERADRSEVELTIPTSYRDKKSSLRAFEGAGF